MQEQQEHTIVEAMGASWDAQGHRPPTNWHIICSCGWGQYGLRDQTSASDAWREHRDSASVASQPR